MIPCGCPGIISFPAAWLTNVDGMKDLWCSSTVDSSWTSPAAINRDMSGNIYDALVQFGYYQHRYEWKGECVKTRPY